MTLAIEPMINIKGSAVVVRPDGTVLTKKAEAFRLILNTPSPSQPLDRSF